MIHIIIAFICAVVDIYLLWNTFEEMRVRKEPNIQWGNCPWKLTGRYKYRAYIWALIIPSLLTIPTALACPLFLIVVLTVQYLNINESNYGYELVETRVFIDSKILKFLNSKI